MNKRLWHKVVKFHGHECIGLAVGCKACEAAVRKMNIKFPANGNIICVAENNGSGVDAIQVITGCTFGQGTLLFRDVGKIAYSFYDLDTGNSIRLSAKRFPEGMDKEESIIYILKSPVGYIFDIKKPMFYVQKKDKKIATVVCERCKESTFENKIRFDNGEKVCLDCLKWK